MLLELAVGDAYGSGFEYVHPEIIRARNDLTGYMKHPRHGTELGYYTDDTQMSVGMAEVIVSGLPWTPENLAEKFVEVFKRDPREGYASGFYGFLTRIKDGKQFLEEIRPVSDKSGAAMRAGPIGIFPTVDEVVEKCSLQAAITHNTRDGINAAVAASLMTHYFIYDLGSKQELGRFLEEHVEGQWSEPWHGMVGPKGWMSVRAAITALMRKDSMSALLKDCIAFSGDVDTVATIALAAGSCSSVMKQDIPRNLVENLENGPYGRDYLIELDRKLFQLA